MNEKKNQKTLSDRILEIHMNLEDLDFTENPSAELADVDPEILSEEADRLHETAHIRPTADELDEITGRDEDDHDE
ncbi:MAG TPA: hypothetical protein VMU11_01815 [Verrucomicrobiae bacterium]|nr:hypothetical protein [Verrucomicrobiae bacterium]